MRSRSAEGGGIGDGTEPAAASRASSPRSRLPCGMGTRGRNVCDWRPVSCLLPSSCERGLGVWGGGAGAWGSLRPGRLLRRTSALGRARPPPPARALQARPGLPGVGGGAGPGPAPRRRVSYHASSPVLWSFFFWSECSELYHNAVACQELRTEGAETSVENTSPALHGPWEGPF